VLRAAEIVGRKYLEAQVFDAIRNPRFRSILQHLASQSDPSGFKRHDIVQNLSDDEIKALDNFLHRMRELGVLIQIPGKGPGWHRFSSDLHRLYFSIESQKHESDLAAETLEGQTPTAKFLPQILSELAELKRERDERINELLQATAGLRSRSRHEFTEPGRDLQAMMLNFRIKFDGLSQLFLGKYIDHPQYGPIFYCRGLIAFLDGDILTAHRMLKISETLAPFTETNLSEMSRDLRARAAFTQFYLALLEKNYGTIPTAQDYIQKSYCMYGKEEKSELLTLVTLAELLSYLPEGVDSVRTALEELFKRVQLKVAKHALTKAEAQYIPRAHMIYGNTFFVEKKWQEARGAFERVLEINHKHYYAHYSLGQILQAENNPKQAQIAFDRTFQCLLDSKHLETKPERSTQIALNALAYLCLRNTNKVIAQSYLDTVREHLTKIREIESFELKLFSFKKKQPVAKDEFWKELIE